MRCETLIVLFLCAALADEKYEDVLRKLWLKDSVASAPRNRDDGSVYRYAFKPRAIPLRREDVAENKSEVLFHGDYVPIARVKSVEQAFQPRAIPLIRNEEFEERSLGSAEEPIIEKPEGFTEAQRRSISDLLSEDEDEEEEDEDGEYETEDVGDLEGKKSKLKKKRNRSKKLKKYMLPLLMAYKMKYFALVPVMIGGLVLLVGATGLAGFFFALFAAVMGLQKGGY